MYIELNSPCSTLTPPPPPPPPPPLYPQQKKDELLEINGNMKPHADEMSFIVFIVVVSIGISSEKDLLHCESVLPS